MSRFVLYCRSLEAIAPSDVPEPEAAARAVRAAGATVLGRGSGTLIIEAQPEQAERIARQLPGWSCTPETRDIRTPRPPRLGAG
ncbi:hypothetical protein OOT46_18385 [Aquabacterium sp. A7-Y]|uniref:hypothetical protein n=1 Tax=Aquabacterium sp. A7-Y TaxID=1349605 RepID=UPI00223DE154|nr:hypothetical protein [Aquabacterium sp. A7-Y]MCW7539806.1 hypothetical protein [Aquabacterium sp. A7-Y]